MTRVGKFAVAVVVEHAEREVEEEEVIASMALG